MPRTPICFPRPISSLSLKFVASRSSKCATSVASLISTGQDLAGKTVLIVGLGRSGRSAARLAFARGASVIGVDENVKCSPLALHTEIDMAGPLLEARVDEEDAFLGGRNAQVIRTELGPFQSSTFFAADLVVLSPGIPLSQMQVKSLRLQDAVHHTACGVPVLSEIAFASQCFPPTIPISGITGTNGKSTVCSFVGQLLNSCGGRTFVGGNFGTPLSECALEFVLAKRQRHQCEGLYVPWPFDSVVVECSSYQLEHPGALRFDVACLLNITSDHLERHGTMAQYAAVKRRIFSALSQSMTLAITPAVRDKPNAKISSVFREEVPGFNSVGPATTVGTGVKLRSDNALELDAELVGGNQVYIGSLPGVVVDSHEFAKVCLPDCTDDNGLLQPMLVNISSVTALSTHNGGNAGVSILLAHSMNPTTYPLSRLAGGLFTLATLPHRMQLVATTEHPVHKSIYWVDDSKATNIQAAATGLAEYEKCAVVLIGGQAKRNVGVGGALGFRALLSILSKHQGVVAFGESGSMIASELRALGLKPITEVKTLHDAVDSARRAVKPGGAIVLSPACASFDEFDDFVHRGRVFSYLAVRS